MNKSFYPSAFAAVCLFSTQANATDVDAIRTFERGGKISFLVSDKDGVSAATPAAVVLPAISGAPHECGRRYYPSLSERWLQQGTVLISMRIDMNGRAENVAVAKSSVHSRLNEAAQACVKSWSYLPAKREGRAVEVQHIIEVDFVLLDPGESLPKHPGQ